MNPILAARTLMYNQQTHANAAACLKICRGQVLLFQKHNFKPTFDEDCEFLTNGIANQMQKSFLLLPAEVDCLKAYFLKKAKNKPTLPLNL